MKGLEWGKFYELYHKNSYNPADVSKKLKELYADYFVKNRKGVYEYILGGCTQPQLLDIRMFDEPTKKAVFAKQTADAESKGISNCPLCAIGNDSNKTRIYKQNEMDADHVYGWSKGS